jgi:hypothetical protein
MSSLIGIYFIFCDTEIITNRQNYLFQKKLKKIIESGAKELNLNDLTDFKWDKVLFYIDYDYKTNELDKSSGSWPIDFIYNEEEIRSFRIKYSIIDLSLYNDYQSSFSYGAEKLFKIENNFIFLDQKGEIK